MGYVEETGAAQYLRDARITTIYEGTTGIQANDLIGRKTARDGGAQARSVIAAVLRTAADLAADADATVHPVGIGLAEAVSALEGAVDWVVKFSATDSRAVHAGAVAYLRLWGLVTSAWQLGRAALIAARRLRDGGGDEAFLRTKITTARYFAMAILPESASLARTVTGGAAAALDLAADQF